RTPEGTPPVSTRLWPCWTAILSILCCVLQASAHCNEGIALAATAELVYSVCLVCRSNEANQID
ncbi:MAG: hypothetical protein AABZ17_08210, partial [Nitrospirota bacterium]